MLTTKWCGREPRAARPEPVDDLSQWWNLIKNSAPDSIIFVSRSQMGHLFMFKRQKSTCSNYNSCQRGGSTMTLLHSLWVHCEEGSGCLDRSTKHRVMTRGSDVCFPFPASCQCCFLDHDSDHRPHEQNPLFPNHSKLYPWPAASFWKAFLH